MGTFLDRSRKLALAVAALLATGLMAAVAVGGNQAAAQTQVTCFAIADRSSDGGDNQSPDTFVRIELALGTARAEIVATLPSLDAEAMAIRQGQGPDNIWAWDSALNLFLVNPTTGTTSDAPFAIASGDKVEGLTWAHSGDNDPSNDVLYAILTNGDVIGHDASGAVISTQDVASEPLVGADVAWDPTSDTLYAVRGQSNGNGTQLVVVPSGESFDTEFDLEGLGFADSGQMIGTTGSVGDDSLHRIDKATGETEVLLDLGAELGVFDHEDVDCLAAEPAPPTPTATATPTPSTSTPTATPTPTPSTPTPTATPTPTPTPSTPTPTATPTPSTPTPTATPTPSRSTPTATPGGPTLPPDPPTPTATPTPSTPTPTATPTPTPSTPTLTAAIDIETLTNLMDADDPGSGPEVVEGDRVKFAYVVTNTGTVDLVDAVITDTKLGRLCTIDRLQVDDSKTCTTSILAQAGPEYANVGSVTATPVGGGPAVSDSDPSHHTVVVAETRPSEPGVITIDTRTNGTDGPLLAERSVAVITYEVMNIGTITLSNVEVTDSRDLTIHCDVGIATLIPGQRAACTAYVRVNVGRFANVGTVTAVTPDRTAVAASDATSHTGIVTERRPRHPLYGVGS